MGNINVSSTLDRNTYELWKKSGMRLNHVIKMGMMHATETPGYIQRIRELEASNEKLASKLESVMRKINEV